MGQDKPPQYSDAPSSNQYTPKFSPEQISFLSLVHQFAAVKPLSLKVFLNLISEDEELFSKEFPEIAHEPLVEEIDAMLVNPTYKSLLSAHISKQDYSATLVSIMTLISITMPNQGLSSQHSLPHTGTNTHDQPPHAQAVETSQEKSSSTPDGQSIDQCTPKFSPEQKSFLDLVHRFAAVKPLSLKIFLNLVSEDDELLSIGLPGRSQELIGAEIDGMLTNPTFKSLLSAHLANRDYSAALISITTLIAISTPVVDVGEQQPITYPHQVEDDSSNGHKSAPDLVQRFAAAGPLTIQKFLDLVVDDVELLSATFPDRSRGSIVVEIDRLSVNPSFRKELGVHLEKQDYLAALLATTTWIVASSPKVDSRAPQHGVPLENLSDSYSKGLYGLYDLLWNRQENITVSHSVMVPSLPRGYINFDQSAPTAILPPSFGERQESYSYDILVLPDDSDAILPTNDRQLKSILIRSCYRDIHKELKLNDQHAVILGQPGTGKSCLLVYILTERLRRRQTTVLQLDEDDVYCFSETGAMRFPAKVSLDGHNLHSAWFLVDCSEHRQTIPDTTSSIYRFPSSKVVHAISPRNSRHMAWSQEPRAKELLLGICSWEELHVIRSTAFAGLSVNDEQLAFSYLKHGSDPRTCTLAASSTAYDTKRLRDIRDELKAQKWTTPLRTATSSLVLAVIIPSGDPTLAYAGVRASPYLVEQIYQRALQKSYGPSQLAEFRPYWKAMGCIPHMFETWCHLKLSAEKAQTKVARLQTAQGQELSYYQGEVSRFTDLEDLKKTCNGPSPYFKLFVPDGCAFPVDAVSYYNGSNYWLILFTAGKNRVVDGKALKRILPVCSPGGHQNYWKFLLVVPELCDCAEDIRVDIEGTETAGGMLKNIPKYVLRL